jgi:hypothetical protein
MMGLDYVKQQAMPDATQGAASFIDDGEVVADSTFIRRPSRVKMVLIPMPVSTSASALKPGPSNG